MSDQAALALKGMLDAAAVDGVPRMQQMVVESTREDGRVNLSWGGTIFDGIPCSTAYANRAEGDRVSVEITSAGWIVHPPVGAEPAVVTAADIADVVRTGDLDDYVKVGDAEQTTTTWGTGAPTGTGWRQATSVWVRDNQVYAQLAAASDPPPNKPRPKHWPDATFSANSDALYSHGRRYGAYNNGHPVQGGYGNYAGAWFYGSKFADACAGKPTPTIQFRLVRRASGTARSVRPDIYLHNSGSNVSSLPSMTDHWSPGKGLSRGEGYTYTLPGSLASKLASGAAKGVGVKAGGGFVLLFTASSGAVRIKF